MESKVDQSVDVRVALLGGRSCSVCAAPFETLDQLQTRIAEALDIADAGELSFSSGEAVMLVGTETASDLSTMGTLQATAFSPYPLEVEGFMEGVYDPLPKRFKGKPIYKLRGRDAFLYYKQRWTHSPDYCSNAWQIDRSSSNVPSPDLCKGPWMNEGMVIRRSDAEPLPEQPLPEMVSCEVSLQCKLCPWFPAHGNLLPVGSGSKLDWCPATFVEMRFSDETTASNLYVAAKYGFEWDFSGDPDGLLCRPSDPGEPLGQLIASGKGVGTVKFGICFKKIPDMKHSIDVHIVSTDFNVAMNGE